MAEPNANNSNPVTYFAETDFRNKKTRFGIKAIDRARHVYVIGKTGMGKSTLLENMAVQDIQNGHGMAFMDPHGSTAEKLLDYVPEHRIKDVIYFAPFDMEHPISFNVMEDVGYDKRHLVVSGLMSTFKKIWVDAWSARMEYILNNILLALLEYPDATLLGVNRMLSDKDYRKKVIDNVSDPAVKSFWIDEFAKYGDKYMQEAGAAIQNKIGQFTSNPLIRNIIGQPKSSFDIRKVMDERKIMIINLSKGRVGEQNASLLGGMLITKIYLAAMSRADASAAELSKLPHFYLYVDEFQSFANATFADILSEARKYKLNLTIAHQYIEQMAEEVRDAVFGNVGTTIIFRVGPFDAEVLEKIFFPTFTKEDIVNLGAYQIYLTLMVDGIGSKPFSAMAMPPITLQSISFKDVIIRNSREMFAKPRKAVEEQIQAWHEPIIPVFKPKIKDMNQVDTYRAMPPRQQPFDNSYRSENRNENRPAQGFAQPKFPPRQPYFQPNREAPLQPRAFQAPAKSQPPSMNPNPPAAASSFAPKPPAPKTFSLADLKQKTDQKAPSQRNMSQLKDLLAKVDQERKTASQIDQKPDADKNIPSPTNNVPADDVRPAPKSSFQEEIKHRPKEVPEDILRKILE